MAVVKQAIPIVEVKKHPNIDAWSYSRWAVYSECAAKAKFKFVDKLPEPGGPALERGTAIHKLAEDYLRGPTVEFPAELVKLKKQYAALRKMKPAVEIELALNRKWERVGWFDKGPNGAWCRIKIDAITEPAVGLRKVSVPVARVVDHKTGGLDKRTGKLRLMVTDEYMPQLELYAVGAFIMHPAAEEVQTSLYYIDAGEVVEVPTFKRAQLGDLKQLWEKRTAKMLSDTMYVPNPGQACRFCHFKKSNNGPCAW